MINLWKISLYAENGPPGKNSPLAKVSFANPPNVVLSSAILPANSSPISISINSTVSFVSISGIHIMAVMSMISSLSCLWVNAISSSEILRSFANICMTSSNLPCTPKNNTSNLCRGAFPSSAQLFILDSLIPVAVPATIVIVPLTNSPPPALDH